MKAFQGIYWISGLFAALAAFVGAASALAQSSAVVTVIQADGHLAAKHAEADRQRLVEIPGHAPIKASDAVTLTAAEGHDGLNALQTDNGRLVETLEHFASDSPPRITRIQSDEPGIPNRPEQDRQSVIETPQAPGEDAPVSARQVQVDTTPLQNGATSSQSDTAAGQSQLCVCPEGDENCAQRVQDSITCVAQTREAAKSAEEIQESDPGRAVREAIANPEGPQNIVTGQLALRTIEKKPPESWSRNDFQVVLDNLKTIASTKISDEDQKQISDFLQREKDKLFSIFTNISYRRRSVSLTEGEYQVRVMYGCAELYRNELIALVRMSFSDALSRCDIV